MSGFVRPPIMDLTTVLGKDQGLLALKMGIQWHELSPEYSVATMPVEGNTQTFGILHGGSFVVLGESMGSIAANVYAHQNGLGTAVGIVLASVLAMMKFGFGWEIVQAIAVFVVVQGIEGYLLTPRIVGDKVGLHPLVVMVALLVGGSLLGIWGMFLAIPLTAVLSVFAAEWLSMYKRSHAYSGAE